MKLLKLSIFWLAMGLIISLTLGNVQAQTRLTEQTRVTINSFGPIQVGMTITQASRTTGINLIQRASGGEEYGCLYYEVKGTPRDVSFMVTEGKIARIDIDNRNIMTLSGAKIGDTERRILSLYPGQIQVSQHEYVAKGHYLTFIPRDRRDSNYRLVFETDGNKVTHYRAGKLPEVEYIEGCA